MRGGIFGQKLPIVREAHPGIGLQSFQGHGQGHIAVRVVVPVRLPVRRDVGEASTFIASRMRHPHEGSRQGLTVVQQLFERHGPGRGTVVEEQRDVPAGRQTLAVGDGRVRPSFLDFCPLVRSDGSHAAGLVGSKNREQDSLLRQGFERVQVDCGLR